MYYFWLQRVKTLQPKSGFYRIVWSGFSTRNCATQKKAVNCIRCCNAVSARIVLLPKSNISVKNVRSKPLIKCLFGPINFSQVGGKPQWVIEPTSMGVYPCGKYNTIYYGVKEISVKQQDGIWKSKQNIDCSLLNNV